MDPANPVADTHFVSIKGDPSPRETVHLRPRQQVIVVVNTRRFGAAGQRRQQ